MDKYDIRKTMLSVPTDFTQPSTTRNIQGDLVPPSHFALSSQSTQAHRSAKVPVTLPSSSWINPGVGSVPLGDCSSSNPWLALSQVQQEILELRKENERMKMSQGERFGGVASVDQLSDMRAGYNQDMLSFVWNAVIITLVTLWMDQLFLFINCRSTERSEQWSRLESQWQMEAGRHKAEARRLKEQVDMLKETVERSTEEIRDKDADLNRLSHEKEALSEELSKTNTELSRVREKLSLSSVEKEKISSQLKASYCAELNAATRANAEQQERLQSITSEVLQLKFSLKEVSTERDGLKEHLSQMGQALETQSATLHSLRNYIGQLAPQNEEREQLNEAVEKLSQEREALLVTTEQLTARLNSLKEILSLQEEKLMKKTPLDAQVKTGCEGCKVLQLWREKVYKLCVQLRFQDIELRREKEKLLSEVGSIKQQLQDEEHRSTVLQHSLDDKIAELELERIEKRTLKEDVVRADKRIAQLRSHSQKADLGGKTLTEAVQRFSRTFESKMTELVAAKMKLSAFTQRLSFAGRRVENIQALVMRRATLQKVEEACKQTKEDEATDRTLQIDYDFVCKERDRLSKALKQTPELIEKALADLKHQHESKVKQLEQELEQSYLELQQSKADREKTERSLLQVQDQLEENKVNLENLRRDMFQQQQLSEEDLKERVSLIEAQSEVKLREMEVQVQTARKEHTKAVKTLRWFARELARTQDEMKELKPSHSEKTKNWEASSKNPLDTEIGRHPMKVTPAQKGLHQDVTRLHAAAPQNFAAFRKYQHQSPERSCTIGAEDPQASREKVLCLLEELQSLSAEVLNSSVDSTEEEGQSDSAGPATGSLHS